MIKVRKEETKSLKATREHNMLYKKHGEIVCMHWPHDCKQRQGEIQPTHPFLLEHPHNEELQSISFGFWDIGCL